MLGDLRDYLSRTGWTIEEPVGAYEVLRARKNGYPRPLLVHNRTSGGCGYSIDEKDMKVSIIGGATTAASGEFPRTGPHRKRSSESAGPF